ncbi:MAG: hypothetical protein WC169_02175 [Dehalococcoidia bacterium]|jgi:sulfite exporter TauE/SafE
MARKVLVIIGGALCILWGIAHLIPTDSVVDGFGAISVDNTRIVLMEWINEGLTLLFLGGLVILVAALNYSNLKSRKVVFVSAAVMLIAMAVLSLFTGAQIDFIPYRLCPVIFTISALLILQGAFGKA